MKKTLFAIASLMAIAACSNTDKSGYTITGTLSGIEDGVAIITNNSRSNPIADTASITEGVFTFSGKVTTPEMYYLIINDDPNNTPVFFLDNGTITIAGDLKTVVLTGPKTTMDAQAMKEAKDALIATLPHHPEMLVKEYNDTTTSAERKEEIMTLYDAMEPAITAIEEKEKTAQLEYIRANPYSPYSVTMLREHLEDFPIEELSMMIDSLQQQAALKENRFVNELTTTVTAMKVTTEGLVAPDFTQNDPNGQPITFSDIYRKNKLTMIDFWASWCGPCRRFNPTLVKLYEKYHSKGFEVLAVSLDHTKEKWVNEIADAKLTWLHVSDLNHWNNTVAKQYNIRYIPQNVFVDATGKIVAKRVAEEEMDAFIATQLANDE